MISLLKTNQSKIYQRAIWSNVCTAASDHKWKKNYDWLLIDWWNDTKNQYSIVMYFENVENIEKWRARLKP